MEDLYSSIPNVAFYAAAVSFVVTYLVELVKNIAEAANSKDYDTLVKRLGALALAILITLQADINIPQIGGLAGKTFISVVIASLSSDAVYPILKKLNAKTSTIPTATTNAAKTKKK